MSDAPPTLSLNEVVQRTGLSGSEVLQRIDADRFPKPIPLGPWTHGWATADIEQWLRSNNRASRDLP